MNRRRARTYSFIALLAATAAASAGDGKAPPSTVRSLLNVNYQSLVSRADLDYNGPARRSEEGMPVGNGRMGSLVWTTPSALKFQINRVDVFAAAGRTVSFPEADSDFAGGCGYVDIGLVSAGEDGKYHIHHVNSGESAWNTSDTSNEISAMRMIFPLAIHVSQLLEVDAALRPIWREISDNLPGSERRAERGSGSRRPRAYGSFVYGGPGAIEPVGPEPELKARFLGFNALNSFIDSKGTGGAQIFRNRLRLREGPGAIDAEHLGGLSMGIHETMLESSPASTSNEEPIRIFNDWPKDWDAAFSLRARGAFLVSSAFQGGKIPFVEIQAQVGGPCRLANPWGRSDVTLYRDGKKAEDLSGATLAFPTAKDEMIVVVPKGSKPSRVKVL